MPHSKQPSARGRPRTITREKIADVGIEIGLPNITFVGVAAALGVSHMALYKHVPSLEALKHLVAEEIFNRWQLPQASTPEKVSLKDYLLVFTTSVREFVKAHPGVTPYVIRRLAATPAMLEKIDGHQSHIANAYRISKEQSRWLLATVTFFCISAADTVYSAARLEPVIDSDIGLEEGEMEAEFIEGTHALIAGALTMLAGRAPVDTIGGASDQCLGPAQLLRHNGRMRFLHTMLRVGDLQRSIDFYTKVLDMQLLRTSENPEYKYSLAFLGFEGGNPAQAEIELTYNWGTDSYELGTAYGHIALGVLDAYAACEKIKAAGGNVTREAGPVKGGSTVIAFVTDPDGYKIELIQENSRSHGTDPLRNV